MTISRPDPWPWRWFIVVVVLVIVIANLALALVAANRSADALRGAGAAGREARVTADCMNNTLGIRQRYTDADHANERQKIADQIVAERDKANGLTQLQLAKTRRDALAGFHLYQQGVNEFVKSLEDWTSRDKAITAERSKHPLGRC